VHKDINVIIIMELLMSKKSSIKKHISETFDLPQQIILDTPVVKIISNNELTIENHKGILEYSPNLLRMNSELGTIKIIGDNISIKEIDQWDIVICGEIRSLEYIK
jgi:sporulation protein YqfC